MEDRLKGMVMGSLIADSLALPVHWIYDSSRIQSGYGIVNRLMAPGIESYHRNRDKGEFTHYGDQLIVLLESVASEKRFSPDHFSMLWQNIFKDYKGYYDHATKDTISNLSDGLSPMEAGSSSSDFSAAARISPLVCFYRDDKEKLLETVSVQTRMTHNDPLVIESARFFALVSLNVLSGVSPLETIKWLTNEWSGDSPLMEWIMKGIESSQDDSIETIIKFGQSCYVKDVFPGIIHLIIKYENNMEEALVNAIMAGGDNAARGMMTGMVLGAHLGYGNIPEAWLNDLKERDRILELIKSIL